MSHPSALYFAWLAAASGITSFLYGIDKARSKRDQRRIPEIVLHAFALSGGFAGGRVGRALFRHKTRKISFALVLILSTVIHLGITYWLFLK